MKMSVDEIIEKVKSICEKNNVAHLYLFGSYAKGTAHERSDIDFVAKDLMVAADYMLNYER